MWTLRPVDGMFWRVAMRLMPATGRRSSIERAMEAMMGSEMAVRGEGRRPGQQKAARAAPKIVANISAPTRQGKICSAACLLACLSRASEL